MKILSLVCLINLLNSLGVYANDTDCTKKYYPEYFAPCFTAASVDAETSVIFQMSQYESKEISISVWNFSNINENKIKKVIWNFLEDLYDSINNEFKENTKRFEEDFNRPMSENIELVKSLWLKYTWFYKPNAEKQIIPLDKQLVRTLLSNNNIRYKLHFVNPIYTLILYNAIGECDTKVKTSELWDIIS